MAKKPIWIAPRLRCGLGNRLFQTFAAIGAAERTGSEAVFLLPRMSHHEHGNFDLLRTLYPTLRIVETAQEWAEISETQEKTIPPIDTESPVVLGGFFQNSENFPSLTNFNIPKLPSVLQEDIRPTAWAIHFRLGDYCILPHHQIHSLKQYYYQTIINNIPKTSTLVLISDSPNKLPPIAKELGDLGYTTEIYTNDDALHTLKTFAACQGGSICSNSTFAWWGAFFGYTNSKEQGKYRAFFPDTWMTNQPTPKILNLSFTHCVKLASLPASPYLQSFQFN